MEFNAPVEPAVRPPPASRYRPMWSRRSREVTVPPDLADVLARDPDAKQFYDQLSYSNKQRIVLPIAQAKTAETRQRRVAKAAEMLKEGRV